ncbi:MAG: UDP-N-acetylmuramoyl-tripeptide--D-alanyl-D-alanine ligase, partial [Planctomycetes bacterium]|nr:UDP-N-acetylmuramoyl-tripeptide--D-alanyl-D-alanine ligase [Planctomycetota bacterium]
MDLTLAEMAKWCDGALEPLNAAGVRVNGVSTDSRTIRPGELFVAINGLNQDGHKFVRHAAGAGAAAALVEKRSSDYGLLPLILVERTLDALGRIANGYRWHPPLFPWIAVTGSNGKTTTRELMALMLGARRKVRISKRNWNNFVGLPISMLGEPNDAEVAVMEMGTNHPGEIARLREICVPTVAVVTSTGESHLEGFGSSQAVAREKADIFRWLPVDGLAVLPADDPNAGILRGAVPHRCVTFSVSGGKADLTATDISLSAAGSEFMVEGIRVKLPLLGKHNVANCLAAMLAVRHLGVDLTEAAQAVMAAKPMPGRLQAMTTPSRLTIINDSYNANPNSVIAAMDVLEH